MVQVNHKLLVDHIGQDGVPLSYFIRESDAPYYALASQPDYDFEQLSSNCVTVTGLTYKTDSRELNQLIHGFVKDETSETWIKPTEKRQDSRLEYLSILAHNGGKGNKAIQIK